MKYTSTSHYGNPYSHSDRVRHVYVTESPSDTCTWCGSRPSRLYSYGRSVVMVAGVSSPRGVFCNVDCARSNGSAFTYDRHR